MRQPQESTTRRPPGARDTLLTQLKRRGEARAEELAGALGITVSAARQQLAGLAADGLVEHREAKGRPGRPAHVYRLTAAGEERFPRTYDALARELLEDVAEEDPELLRRLFDRRRARRVAHVKERLAGLPFAEQVAELARALDEEGYLAELSDADDGAFLLTEHNCAILGVAQRHEHACHTEIAFLRDVLPDAEVERIAYRLDGAHVCAYRISRAATRSSAS